MNEKQLHDTNKQKGNIFKVIHNLSQSITHDVDNTERQQLLAITVANPLGSDALVLELGINEKEQTQGRQKELLHQVLTSVVQSSRDDAMERIKTRMHEQLENECQQRYAQLKAQQTISKFFTSLNVKLANLSSAGQHIHDPRITMLDHLNESPNAKVAFSLLTGLTDNNEIVKFITTMSEEEK